MAQVKAKSIEIKIQSENQEWKPKTELGRKLAAIRAEIVASGEILLDWNGIAREIAEQRGGNDSDLH